MASFRRRVLFVGVALLASGVSVVAVTGDREPGVAPHERPVAVCPESAAPTAAELERRALAIRQPTGTRAAGAEPAVPLIANPQR